jgi:hypothetical protein
MSPGDVCPLTKEEMWFLGRGFYPASLYVQKEPPEKLPSNNPWIVRDYGRGETPIRREDHYGYE